MRALPAISLVLLAACSDKSPTEPDPIPEADIVFSGSSSWVDCNQISGNCYLAFSITNAGPGCAASVSVVARLYNAQDVQIGQDLTMLRNGVSAIGNVGIGQIVPLESVSIVPFSINNAAASVEVFPAWSDVRC